MQKKLLELKVSQASGNPSPNPNPTPENEQMALDLYDTLTETEPSLWAN